MKSSLILFINQPFYICISTSYLKNICQIQIKLTYTALSVFVFLISQGWFPAAYVASNEDFSNTLAIR